ncbi:MAG: hypothetical protein RR425_04415, partial [Erysipelotrichales bacterium]
MKCKICKKDIKLNNILSLAILHHICNDCEITFQYKVENVKIEGVEIILKTLINYHQIKVFSKRLCYDYNDYCLRNIIRKKHYY